MMTCHCPCSAAARQALVFLFAGVLLWLPLSPASADQLYMGEILAEPVSIWQLDSDNPGPLVTLRNSTEPGGVRDMHLDQPNGLMYWTTDHLPNSQNSAEIRVAALNGTGAVTIPVSTPLGQIHGMSVDTTNGFIFFAGVADTVIGAFQGVGRIPIGGGAITPLFSHPFGSISGVEVDPVASKLYLALSAFDAALAPDRRVISMNFDGTGVQTLYTLASTDNLGDLEIDVPGNRLFFTLNRDIAMGSLDGVASLATINPVRNADDLSLSNDGQRIFFSDISDDSINVINISGTGEQKLRTVFNVLALETLVPEPSSLVLLGSGGLALLLLHRRRVSLR